jgi:hypothetical protein
MNKKIGILYLNHVGVPGGSFRSLVSMIDYLEGRYIEPYFITQTGVNDGYLRREKRPFISVVSSSD